MFILTRQDVEIINVQNPQNRGQQIAILQYQGQTFGLIRTWENREEAMAFWRDLTDSKGKACVLLEEPHRFSVWGKVKIDQSQASRIIDQIVERSLVQACLIFLQSVYAEIEDFLGTRQSNLFKQDILKVFQKAKFQQVETANGLEQILSMNPLNSMQIPAWDDNKLQILLGELHKLSHSYLGNTDFVESAKEALNDLPPAEKSKVIDWLKSTPKGKLWQ